MNDTVTAREAITALGQFIQEYKQDPAYDKAWIDRQGTNIWLGYFIVVALNGNEKPAQFPSIIDEVPVKYRLNKSETV